MNCFFSTIAEKLNAGQPQAQQPLTSPCPKPLPSISDINLSSLDTDRKITLLKNNKATGPDGISPKLLKLAGNAVVGPLTSLLMQSICECSVYNNWKVVRLTSVFKKDDPTVMNNYRPLSLLSVPSKILESCVADIIAKQVFLENEALVTDNQCAYRKGRSTELLLIHLTETWRRAIDNKLVVGAVFIHFEKAFDCVSHSILLHKLEHNFGITGNLLAWLRDYLSDREQYTVINGVPSENTKVAHGTSEGSVLGPILFALYTSALPKAVNSATTFLYADDTTMYCVGESVDQVIAMLKKAQEELALWCKHNSLVPHPKLWEGMILKRNHFTGPVGSLKINQHLIKWCSCSKLLGVTIDNKLMWTKHISELKRGFVNKLYLIKRSRFLPTNSLLALYFKVILPSVTYALPIWGCCTNKNEFNSLESIHCRAARVIYSLPRDMPSENARKIANFDSFFDTFFDTYKVKIATLIYNIWQRQGLCQN